MQLLEPADLSAAPATVHAAETNDRAIRPFRVSLPAADVAGLKRRLATTRWPDRQTVADHSQGPLSNTLVKRRSIAGVTLTTIVAGTFASALLAAAVSAQTHSVADHTIRPFRVNVPDEALVDLRTRVMATRWPEKETVSDRSQGVQLAKLQELVRYYEPPSDH